MRPPRRLKLYIWSYIVIIILAIFALTFNIKSVHLNAQKAKIKAQILSTTEENQRLYLQIVSQTSLEKVDEKAKELGLKNPEEIEFLGEPK
jgi:cell division protein FtsL